MDIYDYTTVGGKNLIKDYIDSLDESNKIIALSIRKAIRKDGILAFQGIKTRQLKGKIHEIKFSNYRIAYMIKDLDSVYFLHIFKKQKNKTERKDLDIAIRRARMEHLNI